MVTTAIQHLLPQKTQPNKPKPTRSGCLAYASDRNGLGLLLDGAGALATAALPEASAASAIAGLVIGSVGVGAAVHDKDAVAGGIAYGGRQAAVAEGLFRGAATEVAHRIGVRALIASSLYDAGKFLKDYNDCLAGKSE